MIDDAQRKKRKAQLASMLHTASGREQLAGIYRSVCLPPGDMRPLKKSFRRMAAEILKAEFPEQRAKSPERDVSTEASG